MPQLGYAGHYANEVSITQGFPVDAAAGWCAVAPRLRAADFFGRGDCGVSGGIRPRAAAERRAGTAVDACGSEGGAVVAGQLAAGVAARWFVERRAVGSGVFAADSAAFSVYRGTGRLGISGPRGADCRPHDALDWVEWKGVYPFTFSVCVRCSGDYGHAHDREQAGADCDDPDCAVYDLLGAIADLYVDYCGFYPESEVSWRDYRAARDGDAGALCDRFPRGVDHG